MPRGCVLINAHLANRRASEPPERRTRLNVSMSACRKLFGGSNPDAVAGKDRELLANVLCELRRARSIEVLRRANELAAQGGELHERLGLSEDRILPAVLLLGALRLECLGLSSSEEESHSYRSTVRQLEHEAERLLLSAPAQHHDMVVFCRRVRRALKSARGVKKLFRETACIH